MYNSFALSLTFIACNSCIKFSIYACHIYRYLLGTLYSCSDSNLLAEGHIVYKVQGHSKQIIVNTLRPRLNGRHVAHDIFKCIFLNENIWILTKISLSYVPYGLIDNMAALVQIMAWHQPGYKPLSEQVMGKFGDAYMHLLASMSQATIVQTCTRILPGWNRLSIHLPLTHYQSLFKIALLSQLYA